MEHTQYKTQIKYIQDRPGHDRRYAVNFDKIKHDLEWSPTETFETGIQKTVQWYLNHQGWGDGVTSGIYRDWVERQY